MTTYLYGEIMSWDCGGGLTGILLPKVLLLPDSLYVK